MAYTSGMSAPPNVPVSPPRPRQRFARTRDFWERVSEGRRIDDLWGQFAADARASYGFYGKDVDWDEINRRSRWRRPFHIAKQFFWALLMKLSPARRVLLLAGLAMRVFSELNSHANAGSAAGFDLELAGALLVFLLLSLELADKVTMKRDLEIAREIQSWLVPSHAPVVSGADIAFSTRPQNSVAGDYYDAFYPVAEDQTKLMVVIADVAGKSVPAALLMATLQASLRTIAALPGSLLELVGRLNEYACAQNQGGTRFTTAFLAELEPATGRLTWINAGHNWPVLRRVSGAVERLETGGWPLVFSTTALYEGGVTT